MHTALGIGLGFERHEIRRTIALDPVIASAPYDFEKPTLGITLPIAVEIAKRPQTSLLCNIGSIGVVPRQPPRERIARVEMGQNHRLDPGPPTPLPDQRHAFFYPLPSTTAGN